VINRIKAVVLALFALYWVAVVVILVVARPVFDQVARLPANQRLAEFGAVLVLTALFTLLSAGIVRGWRWTFWLILVVFLAGILRVPIAAPGARRKGRESRPDLVRGTYRSRRADSVRHRPGAACRLPQVGRLGRTLNRAGDV
jgi:hypothetical protein